MTDNKPNAANLAQLISNMQNQMQQIHEENVQLREQLNIRSIHEPTLASLQQQAIMDDKLAFSRKKTMISAFQTRIQKYSGKQDVRTIDTFLESYEDYIRISGYSDDETIRLFGLYLEISAKTWWEYFHKVHLPREPLENGRQWPVVIRAFRHEFLPVGHISQLRARWHELDTRNGLLDFVTRFRQFIMQIPNLSESDIYDTLISKLDPASLAHLRAMRIDTSTEALDELIPYATINSRKPHHRWPTSTHHQNQYDGPTPMELDAVHICEANRKPKNADVEPSMANYNNFTIFPRLTDKLRSFLKDNNGCFYCRMLHSDHGSQTCPKKKNRSSNGNFT